MEEKVTFTSEGYEIEGLLDRKDSDRGFVVTHPHPLYGGDMHNYVVETVMNAYQKSGYTTLRFNFRGVGKSRGVYDNGIGEQQDVLSAIAYLSDAGMTQIDLAGYSFGAWVNAGQKCKDAPVRNMVMISPPVGFMDFYPLSPIPNLNLVITGSRDDIAPEGLIRKMVPAWNQKTRFEVIRGADHFYMGYLEKLEKIVADMSACSLAD